MNMNKKNEPDCTMPGSRVREGHAATVLSIVGASRMVPVTSAGTRFYMKGPFGWRTVSAAICDGVTDPYAIASRVANETASCPATSINVAQCDDEVSRRTYLALIGGACHEAWHRLYSQQGPLRVETIRAALKPLRGTQINWSRRKRLFMDLQNVFEDVAIERIGNAEFPGAHTKLCDLADFIVRMETEGREAAGNPPVTLANAVFVCLRDMGLGYNTHTIRENLANIKAQCPAGYAMVANGMLTDILRRSIPDVSSPEAIARAKQALLAGSSLTLALEALVLLEGVASGELDPPKPPPSQGEGGKPKKGPKAPKGAKADKPEKAPKGDKPEKGEGEPGEGEPGDDGEPSDGGDEATDGEPGEGEPGEGEPGEDGDGSGDDANEGEPGDADGDGDPSDGDADGDPSDGDSDGGDSDGDSDGEPGEPGDTTNTKDGKGSSNGAGGGEGSDPTTAGDLLDEHEAHGSGTLDSNSALEQGVASENAQEPGTRESAPYRPYSTAWDQIVKVRPNPANANSFANIAREVRKGTSFLKTRLATVFRALENSGTEHGVRVGRKVSDRMLVNTYCELRGGDKPSRPYKVTSPVIDMSVASAVVIDESSSMDDKLRETTAIVYTLLDALDCIGAKSMALGFRSKHASMAYDPYGVAGDIPKDCHRTSAMYYDLFKDWSERFSTVAPRLKEIRATGGTPMADGIEFALNELSKRPEGYRVLFVVTDGQPDGGHGRVIRSQMKRAHDAGILVVGVGLGYGSEHVKTTFDDSVYSTNLDDLPKALCAKLETLVRTRHAASKRGRAVREA